MFVFYGRYPTLDEAGIFRVGAAPERSSVAKNGPGIPKKGTKLKQFVNLD
jgi:hypothetical protein